MGEGMKLLIVDDDSDSCELLRTVLEYRLGDIDIAVANDVASATDLAAKLRPDVILLDLGIPRKEDGEALCRHIRAQPWGKSTSIIAYTGWSQETDRLDALRAGCDDVLVKPADLDTLEAAIKIGAH
jgi:DNA-binding response OmpR family regulator